MGGGSSKSEQPVQAKKEAFKGKQGGEVSSLQSRKQEQMDQVAAAKAARDALIKAEADAKAQAEEAKLLKMRMEQEELIAKQKQEENKQAKS
jgi:hypothetical protein